MIKVFIADDHQSFKDGLITFLQADAEIEVVGQAKNGKEALQAAAAQPIDVMILDVDMPVMNGEETLVAMKKLKPEIKVLILTSLNDKALVDSLHRNGAEGFRSKETGIADISKAIKRIHQGYTDYLLRSDEEPNRITIRYTGAHLSSQEIKVIRHLSEGLSTKAIAEHMRLSIHTIESHCKIARAKTGAKNVAELVAIVIRQRLV
ncbi:MAG: response regulator transcription factor [Bacteroidales bacterium]|jgi:DNA-binding NarL/FixJ family response regulator|nr:response regulator transcription factor [Bacteroidales bacterium]MDD4177079.1 response regulator transcription factor [Bacteroidales bacterium]MDD4742477.1 response regulator transcription factor [Bacteroidales bacterium]MDY0334179.1 response regulator transcription factor [Bacteroidales bacterium]